MPEPAAVCAVAYNHRGGDYSHSLVDTSSGAPAISSNEQDRQAHLQALMQGSNSGWQQAGASLPLIVDLKQPQVCSLALHEMPVLLKAGL